MINKHKKFTREEIASWPNGHKMCRLCQEVLPFSEFHKHKQALLGYAVECKECRKPASKKQWENEPFEVGMLRSAKTRSKNKNLPFSLVLNDIVIPETCPILNVPIVLERNHLYGPTLDRILPRLGYVKENVRVVSNRANMLRSNGNLWEHMKIIEDHFSVQQELIDTVTAPVKEQEEMIKNLVRPLKKQIEEINKLVQVIHVHVRA